MVVIGAFVRRECLGARQWRRVELANDRESERLGRG